MTSGDFENKNGARWEEFEQLVTSMERGKPRLGIDRLPQKFREVCIDLSLAQARMYSPRLVERLNALVIRGYELIYRGRRSGWEAAVRFAVVKFPQTVRREWRLFWLCSAMFWLPFFALLIAAKYDLTWIQAILGGEGMTSMEHMYGKGQESLSNLRSDHGSNFMMFGYYIQNNVSIDFRTFAGGIAAGLGTLFFLLFNGLQIGASAGYATEVCSPTAFWSFVAGHSSFELLGMVVSGMAGMRLGMAILRPGRLPRSRALVEAGKRALPLIYGAAVMTTLAAVVEGFWSAQPIPPALKYGVGIAGWFVHAAYFLFAGKGVADEA
jgi:uncharacterized membrane protein SpoIIM required for sporulation